MNDKVPNSSQWVLICDPKILLSWLRRNALFEPLLNRIYILYEIRYSYIGCIIYSIENILYKILNNLIMQIR